MNKISNILISRTDSIGDVVLTLPMAAAIKAIFPNIKVGFMGKSYTKAVIETCAAVDTFIDLEDFMTKNILIAGEKIDCIVHVYPKSAIAKRAKELGIRYRIGTTNRLYHWWTCNKLIPLSRKKSDLHEAQLNLKLLAPFEKKRTYSFDEIEKLYNFTNIVPLEPSFASLLSNSKKNIILHPKSQGSGKEWPLNYYIELIHLLPKDQFNIFISGTDKEKIKLKELFDAVGDEVTDLTGKMNLHQFISFIQKADALVASGTGPLHLAAALGINAIGLFPTIRPIHPGRWQPIGMKAHFFEDTQDVENQVKTKLLVGIKPERIAHFLKEEI